MLATSAWSQAVGGTEGARPVTGDPGMLWMVVTDQPEFRVLRDYAEPGASTRMTRPITCSSVRMMMSPQIEADKDEVLKVIGQIVD